jgi:serine phosphatase RsbU (regulator of sigma subunit)
MKWFRISPKILIAIIVLLSVITFLYDVLVYESSLNIKSWNYIKELFSLTIIFCYYLYLKTKHIFSEADVQKNLKNFIKLLIFLYLFVFISKQLLSPEFSPATFPQKPQTLLSLLYANLASLAAVLFLIPMLIIIKNLIYYKHKKRTKLYIMCAIISALTSVILTVIFETPLDLTFTGSSIYSNAAFLISLIFLFMLASRSSWITYLSRKEKYYYFLISAVLVWVISYLYDFAFEIAVPYHSLALGSSSNICWFFLVFYSVLSCLNLMIQLPTARVFDRKMKEVSSLHNLSRATSGEFNFEKLVRLVIEMSSEVIESSFTWLEINDENNDKLYVAASKNLTDKEISVLNKKSKHGISSQIITSKQTLVVNDISKHNEYKSIRDWKSGIGSFTGIPLMAVNGQVLGILFAAKTESFGFDHDDVNMLEAYANQAAIALENANLLKDSFERERMEKELQIAREVQLRLLPQETPQFENIQIETLTITAYEVGGDYYDFYSDSDSHLGLIIGDVSGKGTSAAFYMAETKGIIQSLAGSFSSPKDILINTNKILYKSMEKKSFISLLAAQIYTNPGMIKFARAGHCPVIYYNAKKKSASILQPEGMAVGLDEGAVFNKLLEESKFNVSKNDIIAFYTDGLSEARNKDNEEFGEERLCEIIKSNSHLNADQLKKVVIDEILSFLDGQNLHDDLTLILVKI